MDPLVARGFYERGFDSKEKLIQWFSDNCRMSAREYWDNQWMQTLSKPLAVAGVEPYASKLRAKPDEMVRIYEPGDINIAVTGGGTQAGWKIFGGWYVKTVSIDKWR